ncbi:hypothetical protein OJ998_14665 [Solirubrobacter taibaiensis]|nr:hypothetical protein [Solirubrobacter taibaiensis]
MGREDDRSDEALLAATATDPEAFAVFYRRHLRAVLAFLVHLFAMPRREMTDPDLERAEELIDAQRTAGDLDDGELKVTVHLLGGKT